MADDSPAGRRRALRGHDDDDGRGQYTPVSTNRFLPAALTTWSVVIYHAAPR